MEVAIIKYNAGNIHSVIHALRRLGIEGRLTDNFELISKADKVIFPGVGEASSTMRYLHEHKLDSLIRDLKQPLLGICLGQQLLCSHSEEGNVDCLGIFDVPVVRFQPQQHSDKVPHIGWNTIRNCKGNLYKEFDKEEYLYFVHSYYVPICQWSVAETEYIVNFSASLQRANFYATQFHPEKSGDVGERILKNFLNI